MSKSHSTPQQPRPPRKVVIVGGGFGGLSAAKRLGNVRGVEVTLIDRRNHHLFQPLLYQVATAGLSPADIAAPIRALLRGYRNIQIIQGEVRSIDAEANEISGDFGSIPFDTLVVAAGAKHAYFGHEEWEPHAPGLKSVEQATEIRRRVLQAFELAERETDQQRRKALLTFVVVGGGPTGVEMAGAIGEMSRFTLTRDFKRIDPKLTRVILAEAGPRILPAFHEANASRAMRDLESIGVQVWTNAAVTHVDARGVEVGDERVSARTVVWAAGVKAASLGKAIGAATGAELDKAGRVHVGPDLTVANHPNIHVIGDLAHALDEHEDPLPGVAPVAMQQGRWVADRIREAAGTRRWFRRPGERFIYLDKGNMATIGRSRAVAEMGERKQIRFHGSLAWLAWLVVHIYYLSGFRNRFFVLLHWAWSYLSYSRGARLIVGKAWRSYPDDDVDRGGPSNAPPRSRRDPESGEPEPSNEGETTASASDADPARRAS